MKPRLWWIAVLFMVGSALFALGSAPFYSELVEPQVVGVTFFAGSIFFTSAALLQFLEARRSGSTGGRPPSSSSGRSSLRRVRAERAPRRPSALAAPFRY